MRFYLKFIYPLTCQYLLTTVEANAKGERIFRSIQDASGDWCLLQHLLGCCLVAQTQHELHATLKGRKVCEAVSCFFRWLIIQLHLLSTY